MKNIKIFYVFAIALFFLLTNSSLTIGSEKINFAQLEKNFQYFINKAKNGVPFTIADSQIDEDELKQFRTSSEDEDYWIYTILKLEKTNLFPDLMERAITKEPKSPLAYYNLGYMHLYGIRVSQDPERAMSFMILAADQGSAPAQMEIGLKYHTIQGLTSALEWYKKAAKQGFAEAQYILSLQYEKGGDSVKQDIQLAFKWLKKAALQGHYTAQGKLGCLYEYGFGVKENDQKAIHWYIKGAEKGNSFAQWKIGQRYQLGLGVPQSDQLAFKWTQKSAYQGNPSAEYCLALMYLAGKGVEQDDKRAFEWFEKAASQGHPSAQSTLGQMYQQGRGVLQDNFQAAIWYEKAAEKGDAFAQNNIGMMYHEGMFIKKDDAKSLKWIRASACQKHSPALFNLGVIYLLGSKVERSQTTALNLFMKSLNKGDLSEDNVSLARGVLKINFKKVSQEVPDSNFQESEELINNFKRLNEKLRTITKDDISDHSQKLMSQFDVKLLNCFKEEGFMVTCLKPLKEELKKEIETGSTLKSHRYQNLYFLTFGKKRVKQADKLISLLQTHSEEAEFKNQWALELIEGRHSRNHIFLNKHPYFED